MLVIDEILVSDEIRNIRFVCDLKMCLGDCCVEGDAGAPLDENEIGILEDSFEYFKEYMTKEGILEVEKNGVYDFDDDGSVSLKKPGIQGRLIFKNQFPVTSTPSELLIIRRWKE